MGILLVAGHFANQQVPPVPDKVVAEGSPGTTLTDHDAIMRGQDVYQRFGLMDHGTVWGHGTQRGMDFSAYTLHCMAALVKQYHLADGQPSLSAYQDLPPKPEKDLGELGAQVVKEMRTNRFDGSKLTLTPAQAYAFGQMRLFWEKEFAEGDEHYGFLKDTVPSAKERQDIADFFFWTAWAAGTNRPGLDYTYTNNWPADSSVGNK
jgi:nitric oxide reductase subunit B